jgi:hypothetical protein
MKRGTSQTSLRRLVQTPQYLGECRPLTIRPFHSSSRALSEALATAAKLPEAEPLSPTRPRSRITINDIQDRRAKAGKLVAGTAAYSDSDMFKAPVRTHLVSVTAMATLTRFNVPSLWESPKPRDGTVSDQPLVKEKRESAYTAAKQIYSARRARLESHAFLNKLPST